MTTAHDSLTQAASRWRTQVGLLLFLRLGLMLLAGWCFVWGLAVLALRVGMDMPRGPLAWGATGMVLMMVIAFVIAWKRRPDLDAVKALLDSHSQAGGLYMAGAHTAGWGDRLPRVTLPVVKLRNLQPWILCLAGLLFVGTAFATPRWVTAPAQKRQMDIAADVAQINQQLETLEEEKLLEPEAKAEAARKLEQISQSADGRDPVKTWEALDHLQSQVEETASQAVEKALAQTQQMTQAQMLAQALEAQPDALSPQQLARAMQSLQELTQAAAAQNQELAATLEAMDLSQALQAGELSPEQLQKLSQAMKLSKEQLKEMLQNMKKVNLASMEDLGKCESMGGSQAGMSSQDIARMLSQNMNDMTPQEIINLLMTGAGGINRGPGDAPMTWNDNPSSSENTAFKDQVLPPAELAAIKDAQRVGLSATAPEATEGQANSQGGVLNASAATGSAANQTVLPRHRDAVKKYFQRNE